MRMKDVIRETGLSEWTIRYYMKEGLVQPAEENRGGRSHYEFSQPDVESLRAVVTLRGARFTMEEIRTLQRQPERMLEIMSAYSQRMKSEEAELHRLNQALSRLEVQSDYIQLSHTLKAELADVEQSSYIPELHFGVLDEEALEMEQKPKKIGTRKQLIGTVLGIVALILVMIAGSLIWRHIRSETLSADGFLSLEGYQSMEMVNGTCCLVDNSGVVYSMDLATGKQEYLFRGPADLSWVVDPALDALYYFDKQILYEMDTATGEARQVLGLTDPDSAWAEDTRYLYLNYGMIRTRKVLAVTDHYVLYLARHAAQDDLHEGVYLESCDFYAMDRETLESGLILSGQEGYFQYGTRRDFMVRGDTVYTIRYLIGDGERNEAYLTALDLASGEFIDLVELESGVLFFCITEDRLLYVCDGQDALYQVPLAGGEPTVLTRLPVSDNIFPNCFSEDGTLFGIANFTENGTPFTLYRLNTDTGEFTELKRFTNNFFLGGHTLITDGIYYGVAGSLNNKEKVFLGKLP